MSPWTIALLGAVAGFTIFLGLPFGRLRNPSPGCGFSSTPAIGVLLFLLWDVLVHAIEPVEAALTDAAIDSPERGGPSPSSPSWWSSASLSG